MSKVSAIKAYVHLYSSLFVGICRVCSVWWTEGGMAESVPATGRRHAGNRWNELGAEEDSGRGSCQVDRHAQQAEYRNQEEVGLVVLKVRCRVCALVEAAPCW